MASILYILLCSFPIDSHPAQIVLFHTFSLRVFKDQSSLSVFPFISDYERNHPIQDKHVIATIWRQYSSSVTRYYIIPSCKDLREREREYGKESKSEDKEMRVRDCVRAIRMKVS